MGGGGGGGNDEYAAAAVQQEKEEESIKVQGSKMQLGLSLSLFLSFRIASSIALGI